MIVVSAALAVAAFLAGFHLFAIIGAARRAIAIARGALRVMSDKSLTDEQKEKQVQAAAISMLGGSFSIFWRIAATLLLTVTPVYLLSWIGLADSGDVFGFLARPSVIVGATLIVAGLLWIRSKRTTHRSDYSFMDRLVHRLAFAAPFVQGTAADIEDTAFASDLDGIEESPPIFITSLPRAGTTIVLNALNDLPNVATHLYRDMPFIMAPLLWSRLSGGFQKGEEKRERAHGDGIRVGYDSPEAFEEVIWQHFWPGHYKEKGIDLWTEADMNGEAIDFLKKHFRKIVALRTGPDGRYVSKNNGNIARIDLLGRMFPGARIVLPLRDPAEHAASLLRQHLNFLERHEQDRFTLRYMRDIGHFEFGQLHRPIAFAGFSELAKGLEPTEPDYWLAYWVAAMEHAAERREKLLILPETRLQDAPQREMERLCNELGLDPGRADFASHIRKIPPRADIDRFDAKLLDRAREVYASLQKD